MPQQKRGLGKGLGALIPTAAGSPAADPGQRSAVPPDSHTDDVGAYFDEIPVGSITPNPRQPRQVFDEETLEELAASIGVVGLLQPVVVRKVMPGHYEIVMGERRWRACQLAGLAQIPAIVRETSDDDMLRNALIELARRVGRSRPHISNTIRLLNLPAGVQKRVAAGVLSAGHARALLTVEDLQAQEQLAHRIVAEGLSVRAVEEIVALGAQAAKAPRKHEARPKPVAPALRDLADRLSDAFETRVKVELGQRKGKIVVEFASLEDLERIVKTMTPGWVQSRTA